MVTPSSRTRQVERVAEIRGSARRDARLIRCDGSLEELERYRVGSPEPGWNVAYRARRGDLLLSCVGRGGTRLIVSLCRVEEMDGSEAVWCDETDVPVSPPVLWVDVLREASVPTRVRRMFEGPELDAVVDGLTSCIRGISTLSDEEGEERLARCRQRSSSNRAQKLAASDGSCEACGTNLRVLFSERGECALEVHHRTPLSKRPKGRVTTSLAELAVLCATCHRLLHADPKLNLERLRVQWLLRV